MILRRIRRSSPVGWSKTSFADRVFFTHQFYTECAIKTARRRQFVEGRPERHIASSPSRAPSTAARWRIIAAGGQEKY